MINSYFIFLCFQYFMHFCQRFCFTSFSINHFSMGKKMDQAIEIMVNKLNFLFFDKKKKLYYYRNL